MRQALRLTLALALLWLHGPLPAAAAMVRASLGKTYSLTPVQTVLPHSPASFSLAAPALQLSPLLLAQPISPTTLIAPVVTTKEAMVAAQDFLAEVPVSGLPADQAGVAGGQLMDKVLGSRSIMPTGSIGALTVSALDLSSRAAPPLAPSGPKAQSPKRYVHLLAQPVKVEVKLKTASIIFHYAFEAACQLIKATLAFAAGGLWAVVPLMLLELLKMPAMIGAQSMLDLQTRYRLKLSKALRPLAQVPGVDRIRVLTTSETSFKGIVAHIKKNLGFIFLESSQPTLPLPAALGTSILIEEPATKRLRLTLSLDGRRSEVEWQPTLQDMMDGKPIPPDVVLAWRAMIQASKKEKGWAGLIRPFAVKGLKIDAALLGPSGSEMSLGVLTQGQSILHLLRMSMTDRLLTAAKRLLPGPTKAPTGRAITLSSAEVKDAGDTGPWSLPRRLLGRLILRR